MIHWFQKHHDRERTKPRPTALFRRARRLTIERCEDRRMLSGDGSVFELSAVTPATEGGFFELNGAQFTSSRSDSFLIAAPTSSITLDFGQTSFSGFDRELQPDLPVLGVDSKVHVWTASNSGFKFDQEGVQPSADLVTSRYTIGVLNLADTAFFGQWTPTTNDAPASYLSPTLELLDSFPQSVPLDLDVSLSLDPPALDKAPETSEAIDETPTLAPELPIESSNSGSGESPRLLVINDPILILASHESDTQQRSDEGGAIQVFAAVTETQQAFETKLVSAVVEKLNGEGVLPAIPQRQSQPVVAQLARAVAFEAVRYEPTPQAAPTKMPTDAATVEPRELPAQINAGASPGSKISARVSPRETLSTTSRIDRQEASSHDLNDVERREPASAPTERIDQEHETTLATTFATWPVLASVVVSYLLVERYPHNREQSVQTPPRRQRNPRGEARSFKR